MAYEILSDVNKRKRYDSVGEVGLRGGRQNTSTDSDSESENSDDDLSNQAYSFSSTSFKFFYSSSGMRNGSGTWWSQCSDSEDESDDEVLLMSGSDSDSGVYCEGNWQQEDDCGVLTESEPESIHNSSSDSEEDDDDSPQLYHKFKVIIEDHYSGSDSSDSEDSDRNEGFRQKGRPNYYSKREDQELTVFNIQSIIANQNLTLKSQKFFRMDRYESSIQIQCLIQIVQLKLLLRIDITE